MAAEKSAKSITLKVLVDKVNDKVILVEPDSEFVNVLFSFLTIPIANIIRIAGENSVVEGSLYTLGCMKNIYDSVDSIDSIYQSAGYNKYVLFPQYAAESYCKKLKLEPDSEDTIYYYVCFRKKWLTRSSWNYINSSTIYKSPLCSCCSKPMKSVQMRDPIGGFVKEETKLMISDDLHVLPSSSSATISLFTKLGVSDGSTTEERIFNISNDEVLSLLLRSFVSRTPFSEILLQHRGTPSSRIQPLYCCTPLVRDMMNNEEGKICIRLAVSKSGHKVYYAEAEEDFVILLFKFLTLPLGYILKQMQHSSYPFEGCIDQLYKSVQDLDRKYMRSNYNTELLLNTKLVPGSYYDNSLLEVEDIPYYISNKGFDFLTTDKSQIYKGKPVKLNVAGRDKIDVGFLKGSRMFTVTDDLIVRPVSPIYELSILNKSNVHLADIKHHTVNVGRKEALRLLVASFVGNSALTDAFTRVPIRKNRRPKVGAQWLDLFCMR